MVNEEGERRKLKIYNFKWYFKVSIFTPFWQDINIFHFKFEFYDNENLKIASRSIIKKSWNTSKKVAFWVHFSRT